MLDCEERSRGRKMVLDWERVVLMVGAAEERSVREATTTRLSGRARARQNAAWWPSLAVPPVMRMVLV